MSAQSRQSDLASAPAQRSRRADLYATAGGERVPPLSVPQMIIGAAVFAVLFRKAQRGDWRGSLRSDGAFGGARLLRAWEDRTRVWAGRVRAAPGITLATFVPCAPRSIQGRL
jgi:hypothetical protein